MKRLFVVARVSMFPPEHGGAKNIRQIAERLAARGIDCTVLLKLQPEDGPRRRFGGQFVPDLRAAGHTPDAEFFHRGVRYLPIPGGPGAVTAATTRLLAEQRPDRVLLSDDGMDDNLALLRAAVATGRLVYFAQTIHCLPFGPYSMMPSTQLTACIALARRVVVPSRFVAAYVRRHLGRNSTVYYPPVFGEPPFPRHGDPSKPFVTMINPCPWKGSSIFFRLAEARPDMRFAAVPTWGASPEIRARLDSLPNVTVLDETPEVDEIYSRTRVLLAPSLCQEAFGLVSTEALLRGIPVIASDIAGLRESTLAAAPLLPVRPLVFRPGDAGATHFAWDEPENDVAPWGRALDELSSESVYAARSTLGREAAERFVTKVTAQPVEPLFS